MKEYDYYDVDNSLDEKEEDLYSEDYYGDYDDTFVPPPVVPLKKTNNPFGIDINFDDYKLSDIRNVEYEYDYEDYEEETEENEIVENPLGVDMMNKEYEYEEEEEEEDEKINEIDVDEQIINTFERKPQLTYKYKIIKPNHQAFIPHHYVIRRPHQVRAPPPRLRPHHHTRVRPWRPYVLPHRPQLPAAPQPHRAPFTAFAVNIRKKVDSIFKAVTKQFNFPGQI